MKKKYVLLMCSVMMLFSCATQSHESLEFECWSIITCSEQHYYAELCFRDELYVMDSRFITAPTSYNIESDGSLIVDGSASIFLRVRDGQLVSIDENYRVFHIDEPEYLNEAYRDSHTDDYGICDDCDDDFGYKAFYVLAEECNGN